jgi:hypothetical protein
MKNALASVIIGLFALGILYICVQIILWMVERGCF